MREAHFVRQNRIDALTAGRKSATDLEAYKFEVVADVADFGFDMPFGEGLVEIEIAHDDRIGPRRVPSYPVEAGGKVQLRTAKMEGTHVVGEDRIGHQPDELALAPIG